MVAPWSGLPSHWGPCRLAAWGMLSDRGRPIRLLRSRLPLVRRESLSCFCSATDLPSLGRGAAIWLRITCIGPAHRPSIQCQISVPIELGPMPRPSSAAMNPLWS
jgi:hypothetical protein